MQYQRKQEFNDNRPNTALPLLFFFFLLLIHFFAEQEQESVMMSGGNDMKVRDVHYFCLFRDDKLARLTSHLFDYHSTFSPRHFSVQPW